MNSTSKLSTCHFSAATNLLFHCMGFKYLNYLITFVHAQITRTLLTEICFLQNNVPRELWWTMTEIDTPHTFYSHHHILIDRYDVSMSQISYFIDCVLFPIMTFWLSVDSHDEWYTQSRILSPCRPPFSAPFGV